MNDIIYILKYYRIPYIIYKQFHIDLGYTSSEEVSYSLSFDSKLYHRDLLCDNLFGDETLGMSLYEFLSIWATKCENKVKYEINRVHT